ncbi:Peptidase M20 dimerization domain-containing protein [Entamoeba marina]
MLKINHGDCSYIDRQFVDNCLKQLIECDSQPTVKDDNQMIKLLSKICKSFGMLTEELPTMQNPNKKNFVAYWKKGGNHKFVLSSHFDTVPYGNLENWKYPPLEATTIHDENDNKLIYGLGSSDMKGGLVSQLAVLKTIHTENIPVKNDIILVVSCREEEGVIGAIDFIQQHESYLKGAETIIIDEPTNLNVGVAAHGSRPELGLNAIEGMIMFLQWLNHSLPYSTDPINKTTVNIGKIQGGKSCNVVADYCFVSLDIRVSSFIPVQDIYDKVLSVIDTLHNTTKFKYQVIEEGRLESFHTDPQNPYVQFLVSCVNKNHGKSSLTRLTYGTDGSMFVTVPSKPNVIVFGPGNPDVIHKANEYVNFFHIIKASKALVCMLKTEIKEKK